MQPIHIETLCAKTAATKACAAMAGDGRPWLVWSAGDEGLCMARSDSREARSIRMYWPLLVVGVYDGSISEADLMADLMGYGLHDNELSASMPGALVPAIATEQRKATGRPRSRFSTWVAAADALALRAMTVDQMAETLALDRDKAKNVLAYLMQTKRVSSSRQWDGRRKRFISVYQAAA